ncbi:unnamed protein product, partial [Owenia fusiformis]
TMQIMKYETTRAIVLVLVMLIGAKIAFGETTGNQMVCTKNDIIKVSDQLSEMKEEMDEIKETINDIKAMLECKKSIQDIVVCRENKLISGDVYYVADAGLTASSTWASDNGAKRSRLDTQADTSGVGAWSARTSDREQWIQADLGRVMIVTGVITQGRNGNAQWVKSYKFSYGETETDLKEYGMILPGNVDQNTKVTNMIERPVLARFVRINPQTWHVHISLRFDVIGCPS